MSTSQNTRDESSSRATTHAPERVRGDAADVLRVAWPLVVSMLSYTFMSLADTLMVAQLGTTEVAAVGIGATAYFTVVCFGMGLLGGVKVITAQAHGAGDEARGRAVAWQGALVGVSLGLVMLGLIPLSGPIMDVMAGGGRTGALGGEYFGARLWGVVAHLLSVACFGWFEGRGQTALPMVVRVMANVLNVCLDAVLIFGLGPFPEMGVKGAAVATVFALVAQAIVAFALLWHRTPSERVSLDGMSELFRIGGPMGVQWALEVQSWALFSSLVARVGDAHLAAHTIVVRICSVSFLPGHAIGEAASILTGQAVGAGDAAAARRATRTATYVAVGLMGAFGLVFLGFGEHLLSVFKPDPEVLDIGVKLMAIAAVFQVFDGLLMTRTGALNGVGDTRFVMAYSVAMAWLQMVPMAWFLCNTLEWGVHGAWLSLTAEIMVLSAIMWRRWSHGIVERVALEKAAA